ncbi:Putative F-box/FBD/LRR-repeat protein At4g03220 [Linum perenne]
MASESIKRRKSNAAEIKDRISELPDEILHCILRRLQSKEQAAQTIAISKRWVSVWRSYPIVEYDRWKDLQKFCNESINRFSRDRLLRIEILNLKVPLGIRFFSSSLLLAFEQLLYLALERKPEKVTIEIEEIYRSSYFSFRLILNSAVKILRLRGIQFNGWEDRLPISLNSLLSLSLDNVDLDGFYTSLIASSPLLETLELEGIRNRKLQISNLINLKNIEISYCDSLEEINITAPGLQTLSLYLMEDMKKVELTAPQLHRLKIWNVGAFSVDALISKLESLKSLTLEGFGESVRKLKLSSPNLEKLTLWMSHGLREIDLDCGPRLTRFVMLCEEAFPWELQECRINNAPACKWMVRISMYHYKVISGWFVQLRGFIDRFTRFEKVHLRFCGKVSEGSFEEEEVDRDVHPVSIKELEVSIASTLSNTEHKALLDGLFWACRPRSFVIFDIDFTSSNRLIEVFLTQYLRKDDGEGFKERRNWQHQLKDVKIRTVRESIDMSEDVIARVKHSNVFWLHLTWY